MYVLMCAYFVSFFIKTRVGFREFLKGGRKNGDEDLWKLGSSRCINKIIVNKKCRRKKGLRMRKCQDILKY